MNLTRCPNSDKESFISPNKWYNRHHGGIPKRSKGAVSKTARRCKPRQGSNPCSSAKINKNPSARLGFFIG